MKVIYIAAIGHSGSTILDLFLETAPNCFSVGELKQLQDFCDQNKSVDTGIPLQDSEMWGGFCANITEYLSSPDTESGRLQKGLQMILPKLFEVKSQYDNHKLFADIRKRVEELKDERIRTIIDSSKDPHRLASLHQDKRVNMKVIHLIRSPWGVAYSHIKDNRGLLLGCWRWVRTNLLIAWYLFWYTSSDNYLRIFYEDFCADSRKESDRITERFNLPAVPCNYIKEINNQTSYRFAGNSLRYKEIQEIKEDESWKEELSWYQKIIVGILCGPLYLCFLIADRIGSN